MPAAQHSEVHNGSGAGPVKPLLLILHRVSGLGLRPPQPLILKTPIMWYIAIYWKYLKDSYYVVYCNVLGILDMRGVNTRGSGLGRKSQPVHRRPIASHPM